MVDHVGQQLGHYRLLRLLGQGAFAAVYLGEHQYLERPAAIKVLHIQMKPGSHESFRREARTIAQLDHPHIISVHDFGIEDQIPYLVMEYIPNGPLRARHPRGTRLPFERIISYVKQIGSALDYAHEHHVIHRDVKPENILLNSKQEVVLSDFGIAVVEPTLDSLSIQSPAGTPLYMAPEQIQGKPCPASDQYALGVMVYEWITGEPPFRGPGMAVFAQHLYEPPPRLCTRIPELPPAVEDAVLGALAKNPHHRFSSVQDFATVLEEAFFVTQPLLLSTCVKHEVWEETTRPLARLTLVPVPSPGEQEHFHKATQPRLGTAQCLEREHEWMSSVSIQPAMHSQTIPKPMKHSLAQTNRQRLLRRVRSFWITGVLEQSLHGAALLALGLQEQPDAVTHPWHLIVQQPEIVPRPLPTGTRITQVYDNANGELLILGAPGAGKTTLLLELARDLLERAEHDEQHPMPVVFNLSSWAMKQQPLVDWLVEELNTKYQVPSKLGQALVDTDQILPLLDGLDEVAAKERTACVNAINTYRQEHGLLPLVVCSRSADYLAQTGRAHLGSAVLVQPLSPTQVEAYLRSAGASVEALHVAIHRDPDLQTLSTTPLMLSILTLAYQGMPLHEIAPLGTLPAKQQQVFATYVQRMLTRRGPLKAGTPQQVVHWLTCLATRIRAHNQTVFYLEQMQPDWLTPVYHRGYTWLAARLPALLVGILASQITTLVFVITLVFGSISPATLLQSGSLGGLLGWLISGLSIRGSLPQQARDRRLQERMHLLGSDLPPSIIVGLITGLSFGLRLGNRYGPGDWLRDGPIFGVVIGLSSLLLSWLLLLHSSKHVTASKANDRTAQQWKKRVHFIQTVHGQRGLLVIAIVGIGYGLSAGLRYGLSYGLSVGLRNGLGYGLRDGLGYGLMSVLVSLTLEGQAEGISLTERLRWTWKSLMRSLLMPQHVRTALLITSVISVITGLSYGLSYGLDHFGLNFVSTGLSAGLSTGLLYWILLGFFQGVSSERIEDRARRIPNQGIRHSLHNSVLMALISSVIIGVISTLSGGLRDGLRDGIRYGLHYGLSGLHIGLGVGLHYGWLLGLCGGLLVCSMSGGLAALRHGILRLLLWRAGVVPRHYVRFLDEAANCILLQKVGGGYSFVHRLLLDYFAALEEKDP